MSLSSFRDVFNSDSDDGDYETQKAPNNHMPEAIQNIKNTIDKQDKLINLGLRLNRFNDPEDTQRALNELDSLLEKESNRVEEKPNENILVGIPKIGRATCINGQIHHCDQASGKCHHLILEPGEFSIIDGHVVFLSKFRRAIVGAELTSVSWGESGASTQESVTTDTSKE